MPGIIALFAACSPDSTAPEAEFAPIVGATAEAPLELEESMEAAVVGPITLMVTVAPDADGFVEIMPWNKNLQDEMVDGMALTTVGVVDEHMSVMLPHRAPRRDRHAGSAPILYRISLRANDEGQPGAYIGMADVQLAYIRNQPPEGAEIGWNLVLDEGTEQESWMSASVGALLDVNLAGNESLTISGGTMVPMSSMTHLAVANGNGALVMDAPVMPSWSATMDMAPTTEALDETDLYVGAVLDVYTYDDADGDNVHTVESITGSLCAGTHDAMLTWMDTPTDIGTAAVMHDMGVRSGWDVMADTDAGLSPLSAEELEGLALLPSCG